MRWFAEDVLDRKGPFVYLVPGTSEGIPAKDKKALAIACKFTFQSTLEKLLC
jgi:hypothetical protein